MMKITDKRTGRKTFKEIRVGQCFTIPEDDDVYIRINSIENEWGDADYNAFSFKAYTLITFEDDDCVDEVSEIEIIIK